MSKLWLIGRRAALALVATAAVSLSLGGGVPAGSQARAADTGDLAVEIGPDEHVIGDANAPVTIVEYASLTCPHCARFQTEVLPEVKKQLLDTGKARLVFRDFPLDQLALRAAALVRCAQPLQRPAMLSLLFETQQTWATSQDPLGALDQIGRAVGMSSEVVQKCLNDQTLLDAVIAQRLEGEKKYNVNSTPSFVIGGKLYAGEMSVEEIAKLVADATP
ncbi:MAG: DsbA family protein [Alphaproteobacteria bacterium]|nr:DsbA family protein [Alphaproteobacteria bacterium]MCB9931149.1 DsbA family protein [Alphaproteobacteria bacterium]